MDQPEAAGHRPGAAATTSPIPQLFAAQQAALDEVMTGMDAEKAKKLIMAARAHWFTDSKEAA
jgi:hypothetical protein